MLPIPTNTRDDLEQGPFIVFYEVTRACDLACRHCRAGAQPWRSPEELSPEHALQLLDELSQFPRRPLLVFTGGDPLKRPDLVEMIEFATSHHLATALTPSATPLATRCALKELAAAGLRTIAVSLDAARPDLHDAIRGIPGSFDRTLQLMADVRSLGLRLQVNTTLMRCNVREVEALAKLLEPKGVRLWSVFFLVPVGRGTVEARLAPEEYERVFAQLWLESQRMPFSIKTTEAPHYRRFVVRETLAHGCPDGAGIDTGAPLGLNDGKGILFVDHTGRINPSGFLPIECGRFPRDSVADVYRLHPLFRALRDPVRLKGKCGACEYRTLCGGSRARSFALTGDPLADEPDCVYQPIGWTERRRHAER